MRPGGGKEKGNQYERDVCRDLTKWIHGKDKPLLFWRSTTSGGHWTTTKSAKSQAGDIAVIADPDDEGFDEAIWFLRHFTFECKRTKPVKMQLGHTKEFEKLWQQAVEQARGLNREPLLFVKFDHRKELIGCSVKVANALMPSIDVYAVYAFGKGLETVVLFLKDSLLSLSFSEFQKII